MRRFRNVRPDILIPIAVGLMAFAASLIILAIYRDGQRVQLTHETQIVGSSFSARLETHMNGRLQAGRLLAQRIVRGEEVNVAYFRAETAFLHELFGDFQALNWVDADGVIRIVSPEEGNAPAIGLDLRQLPLPARTLARAEETEKLQLTPPLQLAQGGAGVVAYVPVNGENGRSGFLNMVFRTRPLIENVLAESGNSGYDYRIDDGDIPVFSTGDPVASPYATYTDTIEVGGRTWHLTVMPTAARVRGRATMIEETIVVFGVLTSVLLALLSRQVFVRQQRVRDSQVRLQDFATASSDWFWEADENMRFSWFSEGLERSLDVPKETFLGRSREDFREPEGDEAAWKRYCDVLDARQPFRDLIYAVRIKDEIRWIRSSGIPRLGPNAAFLGYRGTSTDVTELVRSRTRAEQANAQLAEAVEGLNEVFSLWDSDDRLVFGNAMFWNVNRHIMDKTGPGFGFEDFIRASVAEGFIAGIEGMEEDYIARRLRRRRTFDPTPLDIETSDGRHLRVREQQLAGGGFVIVGLDVTDQLRNELALRESEKRFALAVKQLTIWDWDIQSDSLYMSPGFADRLGYSAEEFDKIRAPGLSSIMHPDDVGRYRTKLWDHLNNPGSVFRNEHRFRTRSGDYRWYLATGQTVTNEDGKAMRFSGALMDITDRVELEAQLHQAQKMEAIGNLTGGVAHDFNNLLAVVLGNLELIKESDKTDDVSGFVDAATNATRRGAELVKNMLGFARRSRLQPTVVDLNSLLDSAKSWFARVLPANIALDFAVAPDLWQTKADPALAQNAILNIVLNARDAMPEGGRLIVETANVTLEAEAQDAAGDTLAAGDYVMLAISDTGEGIPAKNLDTIFEPFFTTKPPGSGSGLGLSMVQGFMKQTGGAVVVSSDPRVGTTLKLFFPALPGDAGAAARKQGGSAQGSPSAVRLLLVEDNPAVLDVLTTRLTRSGYDVTPARSGDDALRIWNETGGFDLLLTDIVMPGKLQGTQLATVLRTLWPQLPVVFMSGYSKAASLQSNDLRPEDIRLTKPVLQADLLAAIERALAQGRQA